MPAGSTATMPERKQVWKMNENEENKQDLDTVISHMQVLKDWLGDSLTQKSFKESIDVAIKCVKKQIPKKPTYSEYDNNGFDEIIPYKPECPICGKKIEFGTWND